jgi:hypothetical protein
LLRRFHVAQPVVIAPFPRKGARERRLAKIRRQALWLVL